MGLFSFLKPKRRTYQASFSSYRSTRAVSRTPLESTNSARREPKLKRFLRMLKWSAAVATVLGLLYVALFTDTFEIKKIDIEGDTETLTEQNEVNQKLTTYLGHNLLWVNTSKIEDELLAQYPYLKNLNVGRGLPQTLRVTLETFPNAANIQVTGLPDGDQNFIVNAKGYIASLDESEPKLPTVIMDATGVDWSSSTREASQDETSIRPNSEDNPNSNTPSTDQPNTENPTTEANPSSEPSAQNSDIHWALNQKLLDGETLNMILSTSEDFEGRFNLHVANISYLKAARELHLQTERDFEVWLDLTQDLNFQLIKLKKALSELNIYEANLEYVDLRISGQNGEKVIYKLREE